VIYRIAEAADWSAAQRQGFFASPDLVADGFIHFSERHQVQGVSERYYAGKVKLTLLAVDETRLAAPVKRENTSGGTELFPHVYGSVPLAAIVTHAPLVRDDTGKVLWPAGW
jgi:uncharacterized protein (DUF952 family)